MATPKGAKKNKDFNDTAMNPQGTREFPPPADMMTNYLLLEAIGKNVTGKNNEKS